MKKLLILLVGLLLILVSCVKQLKPATVIVIDPIRHYYPIIQGEKMSISYELENTSDNPLFIQEIQTSCGCIIPRAELPLVILPHRIGFVNLEYNTIKNNGFVNHYVYCYGNFQDTVAIMLQFDTNVVPSSDYTRDYEQLWTEQTKDLPALRDVINSSISQKGYYTETENNNQDNTVTNNGIEYIVP
ncbi:MAG: DUF1573 domain-containing protein [Bacteroidaceae bacterium]|nr:DUF1573 domain-containing protein [Bacteroidaceae bacterium]